MRKSFLLLILMFGINSCFFNQTENTFYTINVLGTDLYEKPFFNSKILKKIKIGEKINSVEILKAEQSKNIDKELSLLGNFIKIQNESYSGFIFSSDLSKIKPSLLDAYEGIMVPTILGKENNKRTIKRIQKYGNKEFEIEDEITEYENGTYTYTAFDGCFHHVYEFKNMSFNEVYHQLTGRHVIISTTMEGNYIEIPKFIEKKGNEYLFEVDGATNDLKIIENKNGTYTISSDDCT